MKTQPNTFAEITAAVVTDNEDFAEADILLPQQEQRKRLASINGDILAVSKGVKRKLLCLAG